MDAAIRPDLGPAGYALSEQPQDAFELGHHRRYIGSEDHMENDGMSVPLSMPHGYGRRHLIPEDHQVTREDFADQEAERLQHGQGRKLIVPFDHVKSDVLKPTEEIMPVKVPSREDMKDAIKDWLVSVHNMFIFNEQKWESEVSVEPKGCHWVIEALTQQKRSIGREGPSARLIAEKLAMLPCSELRYFGVRFAGRNDPMPLHREKHGTFQDNRTFVSPGVQDAFDLTDKQGVPQTMSCTRKHPDQVTRRFIASGKDHFSHENVKEGDRAGSHGHSKDDDFEGGLERGMGHGKRFIGTKDHLYGGATL